MVNAYLQQNLEQLWSVASVTMVTYHLYNPEKTELNPKLAW